MPFYEPSLGCPGPTLQYRHRLRSMGARLHRLGAMLPLAILCPKPTQQAPGVMPCRQELDYVGKRD
jgi:hypothetical protein